MRPVNPAGDTNGGDVGVENIVRQHPGDDDGQHGPHARRREDAAQGQEFMDGLPRVVRHLRQHPGDQDQCQRGNDPERGAPAHQRAEQGTQRHAQRQGDGRTHHGQSQGAALLVGRHHAPRVAGQQAPRQPGRHAGKEAGRQGQPVVGRQGRDGIEHEKAENSQQQHVAAAPAARGDGERNGCQQGAERIGRDHLPGQRGADAEASADLRQQAGGQGFRDDADKTRHGQGQQAGDGEAVGQRGAGSGSECGVIHGKHPCKVGRRRTAPDRRGGTYVSISINIGDGALRCQRLLYRVVCKWPMSR